MTNKAVIGLGFGDEGKGVVTEYLCSQDPENTIVVRFSGGHNAGHKVIKDGKEHIFSSFGSGTLSGCPTYWSEYCTFDPVSFWNEYCVLKELGIDPKFYIHPDCPVVTPYDVMANRISGSRETQHGTTGTGLYRTKKRHADGIQLTARDVIPLDNERVAGKMDKITEYYGDSLSDIDDYEYLMQFRESLYRITVGMWYAKGYARISVTDRIPSFSHRVFEGSQGLMLDEHIGHMPHCTPSDITPRNAIKLAGKLDEVFLVTRAYQTRHGNGPMTNAEYPVRPTNNEKETNVCNEWQGEFKTTMLDMEQLIHAKTRGIDEVISQDTKVSLVVTCVDQLDKYAMTHHGRVWEDDDYKSFVSAIQYQLRINGDVYINDSPHSNLTRWEDFV